MTTPICTARSSPSPRSTACGGSPTSASCWLGHGLRRDGQRAGVGRPRREAAAGVPDGARDVQCGIHDLRLHGACRGGLLQHLARRPRPSRRRNDDPAASPSRAANASWWSPWPRTSSPSLPRAEAVGAEASAEAAARLGWEHDDVQPQARQRVREARQASASMAFAAGEGKLATNRRARLVGNCAVATRLVSVDDLALLDRQPNRRPATRGRRITPRRWAGVPISTGTAACVLAWRPSGVPRAGPSDAGGPVDVRDPEELRVGTFTGSWVRARKAAVDHCGARARRRGRRAG